MSTYIRSDNKRLHDYEDCPPLLKRFLRHIVTIQGLTIRTANQYYVNIRLFLRYIRMLKLDLPDSDYETVGIDDISREDLVRVTKDDVLSYLFFLAGRGDEVVSRGNKLSSIKSFYRYLCDSEGFEENPAAQINRPKLPKRDPKYLSLEEARELLEAARQQPESERDVCIVTLLLNCGMRLSELCSMDTDAFKLPSPDDPEEMNCTLKIIGKGNKERTVYLNTSCVEALREWLAVRATYPGLEQEKALFCSKRTRQRLTGRAVEKIIERILQRAGLSGKGYSPHKLRHTAATLMYEGGADVLELKDVLGHEHTTTTEIYTHLNNKRLRDVTENNPLNRNRN